MRLRDALDLCTDRHSDDWVEVPGERPATAMLAGCSIRVEERTGDPTTGGTHDRGLRAGRAAIDGLAGSGGRRLARPVSRRRNPGMGRDGRARVEACANRACSCAARRSPDLAGASLVSRLGLGYGGYVADFQPVFSDQKTGPYPEIERWEASAWAVGLAGLMSVFSASGEWRVVLGRSDGRHRSVTDKHSSCGRPARLPAYALGLAHAVPMYREECPVSSAP